MSKVYVVFWGFQSCDAEGPQFDSVWTDKTLLEAYLNEMAKVKHLTRSSKITNYYTDGDYYFYADELTVNSEFPYAE